MSFERLLVGIDLSVESAVALEQARALLTPGGELHLVHVVDSSVFGPLLSARFSSGRYRADLVRETRPRLEAFAREHPGSTAESLEVRTGAVVDELLAAALETSAGAIVVGAHAKSTVARLLLGSVPEELARRSTLPVVVTHGSVGRDEHPGRVIAAVDFSTESLEAVRVGWQISRRLGQPLEVVHVLDPERPRAASGLESLVAMAIGPERVNVSLCVGAPAAEILRDVTARDVIICGTHRWGALDRVIHGSASTELLRQAPGTVVVAGTGPVPVAAAERRVTAAGDGA